jgi:hypothetical protein
LLSTHCSLQSGPTQFWLQTRWALAGTEISAEPATATAKMNAWAVRISGFLFLGFALRQTRENECRSGRMIEDEGNPQFQNTVPSTPFDSGALYLPTFDGVLDSGRPCSHLHKMMR